MSKRLSTVDRACRVRVQQLAQEHATLDQLWNVASDLTRASNAALYGARDEAKTAARELAVLVGQDWPADKRIAAKVQEVRRLVASAQDWRRIHAGYKAYREEIEHDEYAARHPESVTP